MVAVFVGGDFQINAGKRIQEDISLNDISCVPSCLKCTFVLISQSRSVSYFSHQSIKAVILC